MSYVSADLIDLKRYPIHQDGSVRTALLKQVRSDLDRDGCAVIKQFLSPKGIDALCAEAGGVADKGHRSFNRTNVYFTKDDPNLPSNDPRRQFLIAQIPLCLRIILPRWGAAHHS